MSIFSPHILTSARLTKAHTGDYLAEKLMECMWNYGIEYQVSLSSHSLL